MAIADFWGVDWRDPELFDNNGTSLVFAHSEKGMSVLKAAEVVLELYEMVSTEAESLRTRKTAMAPHDAQHDQSYLKLGTIYF